MKVLDGLPQGYEAFAGAEIFTHGHLPTAAAYCRCLGVVELVDEMVSPQMCARSGASTPRLYRPGLGTSCRSNVSKKTSFSESRPGEARAGRTELASVRSAIWAQPGPIITRCGTLRSKLRLVFLRYAQSMSSDRWVRTGRRSRTMRLTDYLNFDLALSHDVGLI